MNNDYIGKTIKGLISPGKDFSDIEIDGSVFIDCSLAEANFSLANISGCRFENCNLKSIKIKGASIKNVKFIDCKMNGIDFAACNDFMFSAGFERCSLDYSGFNKKIMRKTIFKDCNIKEGNFIETDLSGSSFDGCDLGRTMFDMANLSSVDFRTAYNYSIDPEKNNIKKARFSIAGVEGLLHKYDIKID